VRIPFFLFHFLYPVSVYEAHFFLPT
jgi:hypothetical protein